MSLLLAAFSHERGCSEWCGLSVSVLLIYVLACYAGCSVGLSCVSCEVGEAVAAMSEARLDPLVWHARSDLPGSPRTLGEAGAATSEAGLDPVVWLARSGSPGDPRMLGEASAATSEARLDPLVWEERRRRRARDLAYAGSRLQT